MHLSSLFPQQEYHCNRISTNGCTQMEKLKSEHEEADTKLLALVNAYQISSGNSTMIRSPHGDIDILLILLLHQFGGKRVLIDNEKGKIRKIIDMTWVFFNGNTTPSSDRNAHIYGR